jgi:hypothetical protein
MYSEYIPEFYLAILLFFANSKDSNLRFNHSIGKGLKEYVANTPYEKHIKITLGNSDEPYYIQVVDKKHLKNLLNQYIQLFKEDSLLTTKNYYSYKNNINECTKIWQREYGDYGASFAITYIQVSILNFM